jgi:predicted MPP superfamily phosphohydrolase
MVFPGTQGLAMFFKIAFWVIALSFIAGRILEKIWLTEFSMGLTVFGSYWLAALLYFLLIVILVDLIRLADYVLPFIPSFITSNLMLFKRYFFFGTTIAVFALVTYGYFNARKPVVREYALSIPKKAGELSELSIVLVSDLHLGTILEKKHLKRIAEKVNSLDPDIILMAGDVIDEDLDPVILKDLGSGLRQLKSRLGMYAVTGNHEYIGGVDPAVDYLEKHGIQMIRDSAALIENSFYLIGREDRDRQRFSGKPRKDLPAIMARVDKSFPLILMDHQPFTLNESLENGVDLHLSGHTHNGQIWPLNYLIDAIYEVGWGYVNKSGMHVYVSSGVGTWGPPVRIGTKPEIVHIRLKFTG